MNNDRKSDVLFSAANTARELENGGIQVLAHYSNGRRLVLIIDRPPPLMRGHVRRRQPNGRGGIERVLAAEYQGLQLEWSEHEGGAPMADSQKLDGVVGTVSIATDRFKSTGVLRG
jgi:hypothetical protein